MPIFHFNVHDGVEILDEDGHDLPDLAAAQKLAVVLAGDSIRELGAKFWDGEEWALEVTNADKQPLFALVFCAGKTAARH